MNVHGLTGTKNACFQLTLYHFSRILIHKNVWNQPEWGENQGLWDQTCWSKSQHHSSIAWLWLMSFNNYTFTNNKRETVSVTKSGKTAFFSMDGIWRPRYLMPSPCFIIDSSWLHPASSLDIWMCLPSPLWLVPIIQPQTTMTLCGFFHPIPVLYPHRLDSTAWGSVHTTGPQEYFLAYQSISIWKEPERNQTQCMLSSRSLTREMKESKVLL